jgi:hypothetical protein
MAKLEHSVMDGLSSPTIASLIVSSAAIPLNPKGSAAYDRLIQRCNHTPDLVIAGAVRLRGARPEAYLGPSGHKPFECLRDALAGFPRISSDSDSDLRSNLGERDLFAGGRARRGAFV